MGDIWFPGLIRCGSTIHPASAPRVFGKVSAAIIGAAQKVEHYEIAGYGTVRTFAELLGEDEAVSLLEETLEEEKETDQKLTELADQINVEASEGEDAESEDIEGEELEADQQTAKRGRTSRKRPAA